MHRITALEPGEHLTALCNTARRGKGNTTHTWASRSDEGREKKFLMGRAGQ